MPTTTHQILEIRQLTAATVALRFTREGLGFRAGQHLTLSVPGTGEAREYSVYSGEADPWLEVLVRVVQGGALSPHLGALAPGDPIEVEGPAGVFVLDPRRPATQPVLLVATGTGIAPFHAMFRTHPELDATVLHGVRYPDEAYDREHYPPERLVLCCSRCANHPHDRVTDWLRAHPVPPATAVYLCGNAAMIDEAMDLLLEGGHPPHLVSTEVYF